MHGRCAEVPWGRLQDQQSKFNSFADCLCRCNAIQLIMNRFQIVPHRMMGNIQNDGNLPGGLAECDPSQTLEFSRCQVWPILAKYFGNNPPVKPVSNLD